MCISRCEGTNSHGGGAILVSDTRTMVWKGKPVTEDTRCNHNLSLKTLRAFKLSLSQWYGKENMSQTKQGAITTCLSKLPNFYFHNRKETVTQDT